VWVALARDGALAIVVLSFLAWVLAKLLGPVLDFAMSGPNANHATVQRIGGYFQLLTVDNLTFIMVAAAGIALLGHAATQRRVGP